MVRRFGVISNQELDVGFLEFAIVTEEHFIGISPLVIVESFNLQVTEEIAVCGYPYGTSMLKKHGKVYRWGPVVQCGYLSAISPFDTCLEPNELLLDVRTAGGMSGAPIFRPSNGEVIGIHHSGWEATTALGLPLIKQKVDEWLTLFDTDSSITSHSSPSFKLSSISST